MPVDVPLQRGSVPDLAGFLAGAVAMPQAMVERTSRPFSHRDSLPKTEHQAGPKSGTDQWGKCFLRTPTFKAHRSFSQVTRIAKPAKPHGPRPKRCPFSTPRPLMQDPPSSHDRGTALWANKAPTVLHKGHKPGHHQASRVVRVGHKAVRRDGGLSNKQN